MNGRDRMQVTWPAMLLVLILLLSSCSAPATNTTEELSEEQMRAILSEFTSNDNVLLENAQKYFSALSAENTNLITPAALQELLQTNKDVLVVDLRKKEDYDKGHIQGAKHIFWHDVGKELGQLPKDKRFFMTCYSGQSAGQVIGVLKMLGYDAVALAGGMTNGWLKNELPVVTGE